MGARKSAIQNSRPNRQEPSEASRGSAREPSLSGGRLTATTQDHAWFVAYAPADAPKIAVAVLVEHGGHGGAAAAPVARKVIEEYFRHAGTKTAQ